MSKREAIHDLNQAIQHLESAITHLDFHPYPASISKKVAIGLETREEVEGNHGRSSMQSFPTPRGKDLDVIRWAVSDSCQKLKKFTDKVVA